MSDTIGHLVTAVVDRTTNESQGMPVLTVHEECHNGRSDSRFFFALIVPEGMLDWYNAMIAGFPNLVIDTGVNPMTCWLTSSYRRAIGMEYLH